MLRILEMYCFTDRPVGIKCTYSTDTSFQKVLRYFDSIENGSGCSEYSIIITMGTYPLSLIFHVLLREGCAHINAKY